MKTLIVTNYYLPGIKGGGPVNSIKNIVESVKGDIDILTKSKDFGEKQNYKDINVNQWNTNNGNNIYYLDNLPLIRIYKVLKKGEYDVIYLNSLFASFSIYVYFLTIFSKTKIILAPRGELNQNALSIKKFKKRVFKFLIKYYFNFRNVLFHATSKSEEKDIKDNFDVEIKTISNLPSKRPEKISVPFKEKGCIKIICVARISEMKNIHYAIHRLNAIKQGIVIFDIYGANEDDDYKKYCENILLNSNIKVNFKGNTPKETLDKKYKEYNLFFLPTLGENFGHSIIEAIQNHIPVLISDNTPWMDLEDKRVGFNYSLNNEKDFESCLINLIDMNDTQYKNNFSGFEYFMKTELKTEENIKKYRELLIAEQ
ncbi:glycosyltransferase family 4 protein [Mammaliicoccus lentus]|uniref:glycosyltransferase family 4 protein n=1 Tax=Mammaliicoccus lentus TaxID=42858 RepID=UPI00214CEDC4|nr:glycosyltransferase family 4 protein [Mammaliicoccus lentus]MCR1871663.1 glycosyltransferase family 4 protein [Mammaliicoccus lentus]